MSVKAFGIAVKLTFEGNNQFTHASTYVFLVVLVVTTLTQTHYLNKAMSCFSAYLSVPPSPHSPSLPSPL
jgi:magnesium transporter